jgi:hypothetical protein
MRQFLFDSAFVLDTYYDKDRNIMKRFNRLFTEEEIQIETAKLQDGDKKLAIKEIGIIRKF